MNTMEFMITHAIIHDEHLYKISDIIRHDFMLFYFPYSSLDSPNMTHIF
jgi:hypothetical protein